MCGALGELIAKRRDWSDYLTITVHKDEAKRILELAWPQIEGHLLDEVREDKKILESFRAECESANGGKL